MIGDKSQKEKKLEAIEYYAEVPVYRYTAMHIGISEDTLGRWREADADFAERLDQGRASWVRKRLPKARVEFALERLEREVFAPPKHEAEVTLKENPVAEILKAAGLTGGENDDRKNDDDPKGSSQSQT